MKNRLLVLFVATMLGFALVIVGCGDGLEEVAVEDAVDRALNPEEVVDRFIVSIKAFDMEEAKNLISNDYLEKHEDQFEQRRRTKYSLAV